MIKYLSVGAVGISYKGCSYRYEDWTTNYG